MRAARFHAREDLRVEDVPEPSPARGEVKLRNAFSGICGSDLHVYFDPEHSGLNFTRPHPLTGAMPPQILGHEFSGRVVEVGEGVEGVMVGDRAAVYPLYHCGTCGACSRGRINACRRVAFQGLSSEGGGMAEFTTVDAARLHILPDSVDLRMGALVEPMAVAWHAVTRGRVQRGQSALIAGAGPIGIGLWFALRARGIDKVLVSEPSVTRRAAMDALGATTVNPVSADLRTAIADMTGRTKVDVAFDAAGAGPAVLSAISEVVPGGRVVVVALHERGFDFNPTLLVTAEVELVGALAYLPGDFDDVIHAMSRGEYDFRGWVEDASLDDAVHALHELRAGRSMKTLLHLD